MTDHTFQVGNTNYAIQRIEDYNSGGFANIFLVEFSVVLNDALKALKFCVGSTAFALSSPIGGNSNFWSNANLPWTTGDTISLSIGSSCPTATTPTVNLSAAPNPVPEGSSVTITATLSAALTSNVRIPLTITRGSAEAADIGSLAAITISSGQTSATGSLSTAQDTDEQDETLTVALGTLPSSVTAGTDNSVAITITDDDKPAPTDLTALTAQSSTDGSTFTALALTPATFSHTTTAYSASVPNAVTHLILTPTAAQSGATIQVGKSGSLNSVASGVDSSAIPLSVGANPILVEVTASGGAKNTYTVSITRAAPSGSGQSANADLSALTAKSSTDGSTFTTLALTPSFSASTTAYRASVGNEVTHLILTPTKAHSAASIRVGKSGSLTAVNSGSDSSAISLAEGGNSIVVEVTAENGSITNYRVSITRAAIPTTLTLAASPTDIPEGRESVITATLNRPAPSGGSVVTLTIDASGNTAATEGVDYSLTTKTFTIAAGRHSETVKVTTIANVESEGKTITISATSTNPSLRTERALVLTIVSQIQSERLHETALPEVARAVAGRVTSAISTRVGRALNGGGSGGGGASASLGGQSSLAGALKTHVPVLLNDNRPLRDLLDGSDFVLPFHTREEGGGLRNTSLWGGGEYRNFSGENDGVDFDGSLYGAQIGVDHKVRENLLAGVALSWSEGELEYEDTSEGGGGGNGDYEIDLLAVHPYLGWRSGQLSWWATAGYGTGEVEITPEDGESSSNDVTLQSVSLGGSGLLWSRDDANVRLKGEITRTDLEVEKTAQVAAMTVETTLIRFAAEASSTRHLSGGGHLSPSISLGLRHDGGDGVDGNTSTGAEFHGSVRYANPKTGWNAETSVHTLLGRSDYEEWGILGTLRLSPSAGGHGLSFEMRPGYGNHGGGDGNTGQIWSNGLRGDTIPTAADPSGRLEMRMGYGLSTPGEQNGLLTPWSGLTLHDDGKLYRLGLDWSSGGQFTLRLSGERRENEHADADHAVLLKGEARF